MDISTNKSNTDAQRKAHAEMLRRARVLAKGISEEAMELLREYVKIGLPVFRDCELLPNGTSVPMDAQVLALRASRRDGEQSVVKWLEAMRNMVKDET